MGNARKKTFFFQEVFPKLIGGKGGGGSHLFGFSPKKKLFFMPPLTRCSLALQVAISNILCLMRELVWWQHCEVWCWWHDWSHLRNAIPLIELPTVEHSFIIIMEVLILTLSIFITLKRCISSYPRATGMILNKMIDIDHNFQSHPCSQGVYGSILSLGTVFPRTLPREDTGTHPRAENIVNVPAVIQIFPMQTLAGRSNVITVDIPSGQHLKCINKILYKQF